MYNLITQRVRSWLKIHSTEMFVSIVIFPFFLAFPNNVWNPQTSPIAWVHSKFTSSTVVSWIRSKNSGRKNWALLALGKSLESTLTRDRVGFLWPYLNTPVARLVVLFIRGWLVVVLLQNSLRSFCAYWHDKLEWNRSEGFEAGWIANHGSRSWSELLL